MSDEFLVSRDFLVRVDSYSSLAAYRGIDHETVRELVRLSIEARSMYQNAPKEAVVEPERLSVTIDEINEQRDLGWPDFGPEEYCHRCGGRNVRAWSIDSDRFNMAMGPPSEHKWNGIVCPGCFVQLHEAATGMSCSWRLVPDPMTNFRWIEDS